MLAQNRTLRRHALGRFPDLLAAVTRDPAMLLFLSLANSDKEAPERELRARADGAVHARARLHRARHPPGGARPDRLPRRLARRRQRAHLLRPRVARRRRQARARQGRPLRLAGRARPVRAPPGPRAVHGRQAVGLLRRRAAAGRHPRAARARLPPLGPAHQAGRSARSWPTRRCTGTSTRPTWSSRRSCSWPARCARAGQGIERDAWTWLLEGDGPVPVPAAVGRRLGVGPELAVLELDARPLRLRQLHARHPARGREGRLDARLAVAAAGGRARPPGRRRPVDLARAPTASCCASPGACSPTSATSTSAATCASACCATC